MKIIFTPSVKLFSCIHISALIFSLCLVMRGYLHYLFITLGYLTYKLILNLRLIIIYFTDLYGNFTNIII